MAWPAGAPASSSSQSGVDFTTGEQNTPTCWIDNSAIFQQTFSVGPGPNNTTKLVAHGIASLGTIISMRLAAIERAAPSIWIPILRSAKGDATGTNLALEVDNTNIRLRTVFDYSIYTVGFVTLSYTKTGGPGCGGQPISFFETEQNTQILWVDGKPVFQKTIEVTSAMPDNTVERIAHGISSIDETIEIWGTVRENASPNMQRLLPFSAATGLQGNQTDNIDMHAEPSDLVLASGQDYTAWTGFVTMRYTKN